jgi:hypothetical protein
MDSRTKICLPCEREKAKLPKYRELARERAIREQKIIIVYFDEEDKKYCTMDFEAALQRGITPCEYFTFN